MICKNCGHSTSYEGQIPFCSWVCSDNYIIALESENTKLREELNGAYMLYKMWSIQDEEQDTHNLHCRITDFFENTYTRDLMTPPEKRNRP